MKKIFTIIFAMLLASYGYSQELVFEYDNAGNQIVRQWICVNCPVFPVMNSESKSNDVKALKPDNATAERKITAFPNPLTEVLNVQWWSDDKIYVKTIDVFSLNGTRVYQQNQPPTQTETSISFINLPAGGYLVKAVYSDGKQEVFKVIKQ